MVVTEIKIRSFFLNLKENTLNELVVLVDGVNFCGLPK
jgi:hypothetical protein